MGGVLAAFPAEGLVYSGRSVYEHVHGSRMKGLMGRPGRRSLQTWPKKVHAGAEVGQRV